MLKLRAWLQLLRFPAVFTAMADILLGHFIASEEHRSFAVGSFRFDAPGKLLLLLGASSCLYLSGMAFNDFFDHREDAMKRPGRPIPSGRISPLGAAMLATVLMLAGLLLASFAGMHSLFVAVLLALAILGYDGGLKRTVAGPVVMGLCRYLNVMLGASDVPSWQYPQTIAATAMGFYVLGVTIFAQHEEDASDPQKLIYSSAMMNAATLLMAGCILFWSNKFGRIPVLSLLCLILVVARIDRGLWNAIRFPQPSMVQRAVKIALLSIIPLDATLVLAGTARWDLAILTVALLLPSYIIAKWLYVT